MNMLNMFASCPFKQLTRKVFLSFHQVIDSVRAFGCYHERFALLLFFFLLIPEHYIDYIILIDVFLNYFEDPRMI